MVIVGLILLLPGICAVISAITMLPWAWRDLSSLALLLLLWAFCGLISFGGLRLIGRGTRGP